MSVKSEFALELSDAFVVRPDALKKIDSLFSDRIGKVAIKTECADDVSREFESVAQLLKFENPKAKRILNLRITARSEDWKKTASVEFTDKWYFGGTRVKIEGRDDVVTRLRSDVLDVLSGLKPWYSPINKIDLPLAALVLYVIIWFSLLIVVAFQGSDTATETQPKASATAQLTIFGFIGLLAVGAYIAHRFRSVLFPHGTFIVGQEEARFDTREKWRWGFVVAFFASLLSGVALLLIPTA